MNKSKQWKWLLLAVVVPGVCAAALAMYQEPPSELLKTADAAVQQITQLRGLEPKGPIQKGVKSRSEISAYLNERVREEYGETRLQGEGKMLKVLGLIPADSDYKELALDLLTEQVGGYYDPDKKTFFIAGWLPLEQQRPVMVHELTHALQDQHFDLNKVMKQDLKLANDDRALAHQAIFEGDAMAVMLDSLLQPVGRSFAQLPDLVGIMRSQLTAMESQFKVFKTAPMYLRETLLFPYGYGAAFLQKVRANQPWSAVDKIYADLPVSTEQIIHPEKYLVARDEPAKIEHADYAAQLGGSWKTTYNNVLGEFSIYLLLKLQLADELSRTASAGWDGDEVTLIEDAAGNSAVFVASLWDTPEEGSEFVNAMRQLLQKQYPGGRDLKDLSDDFARSHGGRFYSVSRSQNMVRLTFGLPETEVSRLK